MDPPPVAGATNSNWLRTGPMATDNQEYSGGYCNQQDSRGHNSRRNNTVMESQSLALDQHCCSALGNCSHSSDCAIAVDRSYLGAPGERSQTQSWRVNKGQRATEMTSVVVVVVGDFRRSVVRIYVLIVVVNSGMISSTDNKSYAMQLRHRCCWSSPWQWQWQFWGSGTI